MKQWHQLKEVEMGEEVHRMVQNYQSEQEGRRSRFIRNLELFEERRLGGYSAHSYSTDDYDEEFEQDRLGLVRSAVSHAVADIYAPQKPKPQFQTLGATWNMRRRAYRLDRIVEAILHNRQGKFVNVWAFMIDAFTDAALQGDVLIGVMADQNKKRIDHELIVTPDVFFDPAEGRSPINGFRRGPIDEETAIIRYVDDAPKGKRGEIEKAIRAASNYDWYGRTEAAKSRDIPVKQVNYAYRLPDGPDLPGKYAVVIGGKTVESGDWTAPAYPWVHGQWETHRESPWGSGIADEGGRLAREAGDFDYRLHRRAIIGSGKFIWNPKTANVKRADLELNDEVVIVDYEGPQPPSESTVPAFTPAETDLLERKVQRFWDKVGLSQVSAAARREASLTSGLAQLTLNQTKQGRQLVKAQRYEQAYVDLAHQYIWRLRELAADDPEFAVTWPGKGSLLKGFKFNDADLDDDMFHIVVTPGSMLARDPAGRQEQVSQLYSQNLISQATARQLIQFTDLDAELLMQQSEPDYIDMLIEKYLDAEPETWTLGDYQAPEGFIFDKQGAMRRFSSAWFRARIDQQSLPNEEQAKAEFNINLLSDYIKQLDALMNPPAPPQTANPGIPPGAVPPDQIPPGSAQAVDQLAQPAQRPAA